MSLRVLPETNTLPSHPKHSEPQGFTWDTLTNTYYLLTQYRVNHWVVPETHRQWLTNTHYLLTQYRVIHRVLPEEHTHIPSHPVQGEPQGFTWGTHTHYLLTQYRVNRRVKPETNKHTLPSHQVQGEPQGFTWGTHTHTFSPSTRWTTGFYPRNTHTHYLLTQYRVNCRVKPETNKHTLPSHQVQGEPQGFTWGTHTHTPSHPIQGESQG